MPVINSIISMFSTKRLAQIDFFKENPIQVQRDTLVELLRRAADTEYGLKYDFDSILTAEQYRAAPTHHSLRRAGSLFRAINERRAKPVMAGPHHVVCQIVRHNSGKKQVYPGQQRIFGKLSFPRR